MNDSTANTYFGTEWNYINNLEAIILVKDTNSVFQRISSRFCELLGFSSPNKAIGKTDFNVLAESNLLAHRFIDQDQRVLLQKTPMTMLEFLNYSSGFTSVIVEKSPIFSDKAQDPIGIYCTIIDLSALTYFHKLYKSTSYFDSSIQRSLYILKNSADSPLPLTQRQQECVFLLVHGKTTKEIAYILNLSIRTIEAHFDSIKSILNCNSKSQIIEKAIVSGFLYYIPQTMLEKGV